jgi:ATP-dependent NAD(P)H-hydrate dehydratase
MHWIGSLGNVTIVAKGETDVITDGTTVMQCSHVGSPRRCGGQGDILAGVIATFANWATKAQPARYVHALVDRTTAALD